MALHFTAQEFESRENKVIKSMKEKRTGNHVGSDHRPLIVDLAY